MLCPDGTYVPPGTVPAPVVQPSSFPIVPVAAAGVGALLLMALLR